MTSFGSLVERIESAYATLGHRLGWRFLYGPAQTLAPDTQLAFVGLNPGGSIYRPPAPSVEAGNAYRVERWGSDGKLNPLQVQIRLLYEGLAERAATSPVALMDETLAANFCPFRSPSWQRLARQPESIAFSQALWQSMLSIVAPRVAMCLGDLAARHLGEALQHSGWRQLATPQVRPTGWGSVSFATTRYASGGEEVLVVRLPHLSRFRIFGRPQSASAVEEITSTIAAAAWHG